MSGRRLLGGAAAMSVAGIVRVLVQTLVLPLLGRLLGPHDYGLVALAMPIVIFSMIVCDGGLPAPLMRRAEDDERVWSTAHWTICGSGVAFALLVMCCAYPLAWLCNQPELAPIVMALSGTLALQGLGAVPAARLQKAQEFKTLSLVEIAATLGGVASTVGFALHGAGAWSLVAQQLTYWIVRIGGVTVSSGWRPVRSFNFAFIEQDLEFGWSVLKVNLINFITRSADVFLLGLFRNSAEVGLYAMALQVARLPANVIIGPFHAVFLSHLVRIKDCPERVGAMFINVSAIIAALVVPTTACVALIAPDIFASILSQKWRAAGVVYAVLAPGVAIQSMVFLVMPCLLALGRPDRQLRLTIRLTCVWVSFAALGASFGAVGIGLATSLAYVVGGPAALFSLEDVLPLQMRRYCIILALTALATVIAVGMLAMFRLFWVKSGMPLMVAGVICALGGTMMTLAFNKSISVDHFRPTRVA